MSTPERSTQAGGAGTVSAPSRPAFYGTKLRPPYASHAIVGHERLLALRPDPAEAPVVTVVAPAGYGKTTVLADWADHDNGRFLWLTLDAHDDDPAVLVGSIAAALLESGATAPRLEEAMHAPSALVWSRLMPRLSAALQDATPFTLVFDDAQMVTSSESWDVIDRLVLHVPHGAQVVIAGRSLGGSAMPRLEMGRQLAARGPGDLALNEAEAYELLEDAGLATTYEDAACLSRSCGGWVSGLLMSGAAAAADPCGQADRLSREALIDGYIEAEVLRQLSPDDREFLLWSSVLRVTSAPLCDAVLERLDSHEVLDRLCSSNVFLSRIGDGWCRLHEPIRSALLRLADGQDPERVATLRDRAASWHAEQGSPAEAVRYSMDAGHPTLTIELIGRFVVGLYSSGRWGLVEQWLDWAESTGQSVDNPSVVAAAAVASALAGDPERSERWAIASRRSTGNKGTASGQDSHGVGLRALVAAWQCERGAETMLADATRASELVPNTSPWRKSALAAFALAQLMQGLDAESAVTFERIVDDGGPAWADVNARSGSMAFLATLALRRQQLEVAVELLERAALLREESGITEHGLQALVDALRARVILMLGRDVDEARRLLAHAQPVRSLITWAVPSLALSVRLELIRAHLALADVAGARVVVRETADILHRRPGLGTFEVEASELRKRVDQHAESAQGPSSLTAAELRLVPWLATHLSFREIGERLFLSTNTVKTEALSTYRKLGASSRSEAVEAAVRVGLMDPSSLPGILNATEWTEQVQG